MEEQSEWKDVTKAKTYAATDKKCPQCSGVMDYSPATGKLKCPFCEYEMAFKSEEESTPFVAEELDFYTAEKHAATDWGIATKTVNCTSCGAETVYDVNQMANECPYCGSNQVMEKIGDSVMTPSGVVAFAIDSKAAGELFSKWIKGSWLCVSSAREKARPEAFKGIYLPYWTFDAKTLNYYEGEYGIDRVFISDDDNEQQSLTDWYSTSGTLQRIFNDWLVCASKKQNTNMLKAIEPYNTEDVQEYRPEYMAGFAAERYSLALKDAWNLARKGMECGLNVEIRHEIERNNSTSRVRNIRVSTNYSNINYKYILLPVWMSSFKHNGTIYNFMVNGQNGKVYGDFPVSRIKVALVILVVIAMMAFLIYLE